MPFMMPQIIMDQPQRKTLLDIVPARVHMAMGVLNYATDKVRPQVVANDVGFNETEGCKLDVEEIELVQTAAKTVSAYLRGELTLTPEEKKVMNDADPKKTGAGTLLNCLNCGGGRRVRGERCKVCQGTGVIMAFPANPSGEDES